ncbi:MAG: hypothetical protein ACYST0_05820, partial [Planctomycetota bacterium]
MRCLSLCILAMVCGGTPLLAQKASVKVFGKPCRPTGSPKILHQGLPVLGKQLTITYQGPNGWGTSFKMLRYDDRPVLFLGVSNTSFGSIQLPWILPTHMNLPSLWCRLYVSADIVLWMPKDPSGQKRYVDKLSASLPTDT